MTTTTEMSVNSDFYGLDDYLNDADRALIARVRSFVEQDVTPIINEYWEKADFPYQLVPKFAELGIIGTAIQGYGCPGLTRLQTGLVAMELSRGDGSINTFNAVHSGLAMGSINLLGSDEQKQRWLPPMARLEKLGAFALTEPAHGSDSVALETSARLDGDHYVINGSKRWIGLGHVADLVIIWARDTADQKVKAFVLEKNGDGTYPAGYHAEAITGKMAKRAIQQAQIEIEGLRIPAENLLAKSTSFRDVGAVLNTTRSTVAWESLGHATAAYEMAKCAEDRGIHEEDIMPTMAEWEVYIRVAVAVGRKAIEQGVAREKVSRRELRERAEKMIREARESTALLMREGYIPAPPPD